MQDRDVLTRVALRTSLLYAFFGALWIVLSGLVLAAFVHDADTVEKFVMYKGWTFVAVTAVLLYGALRRQLRRLKREMDAREQVELEMRESQERFATIFQSSPMGITLSRPEDGRLVDANPAFLRMVAYSREEAIGRTSREMGVWASPEVRDRMAEVMRRQGRVENVELQFRRKSGELGTMLASAELVCIAGEGHVLGMALDITERKRAEEKLRQSEARFKRYFELGLIGMVLSSPTKGTLDVNDEACKMLGYERDELLHMTWPQVTHPDDLRENVALANRLLAGEIDGYSMDKRFIRKDGKLIYATISVKCIRGDDGSIDYIVTLLQDITKRKTAEEALVASQLRLSEAMDLAVIVYWEVDLTTNEFVFNDPFYALYGTTAEQEGGYRMSRDEYCRRFVHPDDLWIFQQAAEKRLASREPQFLIDFEHRIIRRDGGVRHILVRIHVHKDATGRMTRYYGANQDITERKEAEAKLGSTLRNLRKAIGGTIQAIVQVVEMRDPYTAGHQKRVADLARSIATEMGLPPDVIEGIRMAAVIHDIGKVSVPAEILSRPGKLTQNEFELIKDHALAGYDILKDVEFPWPIAEIIYQHHERLDGSGYPRGLKGDEVLLEARIIALADVVEAIASHRPFRPAQGIEAAMDEVSKNRGTLYDPAVVDACLKLFKEKGYALTGRDDLPSVAPGPPHPEEDAGQGARLRGVEGSF